MKRLFAVRHANGQLKAAADGKPLYFTNKKLAKGSRDNIPGDTVTRGPDHRNYKAR